MNPVDVELHLFAIGKFLDGKGKKPSEEQHNQIVSFLESETAEHPEDANLRTTLDSVKTMWDAAQNFMTPADSSGTRKDTHPTLKETVLDRIRRYSRVLTAFEAFFDPRTPSLTADKIEGAIGFIALHAAGGQLKRLPLYAFRDFYRYEGEIRIGRELEKIRMAMIRIANIIHANEDEKVRNEIKVLYDLSSGEPDKKRIKQMAKDIKELQEFLDLCPPSALTIKQSFRDEIAASVAARHVITTDTLNQPPEGGLFRIALRDYEIEAYVREGKLHVKALSFNPSHRLTYAINAALTEEAMIQAARWWGFSTKVFGVNGARAFYEMVGYLLVTKYPLPTERTILYIMGDSGTGKGTHLAAVEALLTFEQLTLYAKASPHKLTDPREHFNRQTLHGKLLLVAGDLSHERIKDYSEINDLFGGEPFEQERKFKDPTNEIPTFKAIWASTPSLHKITYVGGLWRRLLLLETAPVDDMERDRKLKTELLESIDGFFLNGFIGLAYLASNNFTFAGEQKDEELEARWDLLSDSVAVWAQDVFPDESEIETVRKDGGTLDKEERIAKEENVAARVIITDLYAEYAVFCKKKQIEPVGEKSFTAWLSRHDFEIKRRMIMEGQYSGTKKMVTYIAQGKNENKPENPKQDLSRNGLPWEAYFSNAPMTIEAGTDLHGQLSRMRELNIFISHMHDLPPKICPDTSEVQNSAISASDKRSGSGQISKTDPDTQHPEKSPEDRKSDNKPAESLIRDTIPNENPVTIDQCKDMIGQLRNLGYHVLPGDSGPSINGELYKIAVTKPVDAENNDRLLRRLDASGFKLANTGAIGPLIFTAPLRRDGA